ncbi:unnamed protein product [Polarella glacialis]|uniref:Uncharacterized protein n=1 Tax=Polarella glacialis TaxID=89957 RepID=A0A813E449_POLGL|nr:unnamed protein product [Polarella glacialis]
MSNGHLQPSVYTSQSDFAEDTMKTMEMAHFMVFAFGIFGLLVYCLGVEEQSLSPRRNLSTEPFAELAEPLRGVEVTVAHVTCLPSSCWSSIGMILCVLGAGCIALAVMLLISS